MTYLVRRTEWTGTRKELVTAVDAFAAEIEAHKMTEGIPAPLPINPIFREILAAGSQFDLEAEIDPVPATGETQVLTARELFDALKAKGIVSDADLSAPVRAKVAV
jgi:hypothetical protein